MESRRPVVTDEGAGQPPPRPPRGSGAAESTVSMPVGVAALSAFARLAGLSVRPSASVVQLGDWD